MKTVCVFSNPRNGKVNVSVVGAPGPVYFRAWPEAHPPPGMLESDARVLATSALAESVAELLRQCGVEDVLMETLT